MEAKDYLFLIGLITTFLLGILNLYFVIKNRKNSLREHIYKEQLNSVSKVVGAFYDLNMEVSKLSSNPKETNQLADKYEVVGRAIYGNEHIIPDEILELAINTILKITPFSDSLKTENADKISNAERAYLKSYFEMIVLARDYYGINSLAKENQTLYKLPEYFKKK